MKLKPTKTELKDRARAKQNSQPYWKRVLDFERTCPYCDRPLSGPYADRRITCKCGTWEYNHNFRDGGWKYMPKGDGLGL